MSLAFCNYSVFTWKKIIIDIIDHSAEVYLVFFHIIY